jgi:hypothetical protein
VHSKIGTKSVSGAGGGWQIKDTGLGKGTAVARQSPVDTYMKALLVQGDKAGEKLHRKVGNERPFLEHIATKIHETSQPHV